MQLHDIVDDFRLIPSADTAMGLARELSKYPYLLRDVSEHTRKRAAVFLILSPDTVHNHHARYLLEEVSSNLQPIALPTINIFQ